MVKATFARLESRVGGSGVFNSCRTDIHHNSVPSRAQATLEDTIDLRRVSGISFLSLFRGATERRVLRILSAVLHMSVLIREKWG